MATELITVTFCDGCATDGRQTTEELARHELSLDGKRYAVDVCAEHAGVIAELRAALERWRVPATSVAPRRSGRGGSRGLDPPVLCRVCGRSFDTAPGLANHAKTHGLTYGELRLAPERS